MPRWAIVAVAVLFAGCASEPTPTGPYPPTGSPTPPTGFAPIEESTLASLAFSLDAAHPNASVAFAVPRGVVQAVLNVTFLGGAVLQFSARTATCTVHVAGPAPADGNTYGQDCGELQAGDDTLVVEQTASAVSGRVDLVALVCMQRPHTKCA